jgi:hypothetical protein
MIITAPTPFNTILWQWINQTYNALLNYGNRNASSTYTTNDILKSYGYACAASISVALGIRKGLSSRTKEMVGAKLVIFNSISAFFACSTAGYLNAYCMRQTELVKGIDIVHPEDPSQIIGKSQIAAKKAVQETAISRYILAIPLFLPSMGLYAMERARIMPSSFLPSLAVQVMFFTGELYFAVPLAISVYPQVGTIKAEELEPEFREWRDQTGRKLAEFQYNKGL